MIGSTVFVLVYIFLGQLMEVEGNSMFPTYHDKERLVVEKLSLKYKNLERGEVVIFQHPNIEQRHPLIKRVVGLPGETIRIAGGNVYINGEKLDETYIESDNPTEETTGGIVEEGVGYDIDENSYFMMGDNRQNSTDSRYFGAVKKEKIIGRSLLIYYPVNRIRLAEQY